MICKPSCVTGMPRTDWANGCNITTRQGGISRMFFLVCDPDMVLPYANGWYNKANWIWALCNGFLHVTGKIIGQMPKQSTTKKKLTSCGPEETVAGVQTVTWRDYNADNESLLDFDFYQGIKDNKKFMKVGFLSCDDLAYQTDKEWDIDVAPIIEENSTDNTFHDGAVSIQTVDSIKPIKVPGLAAALDAFVFAEACYS